MQTFARFKKMIVDKVVEKAAEMIVKVAGTIIMGVGLWLGIRLWIVLGPLLHPVVDEVASVWDLLRLLVS